VYYYWLNKVPKGPLGVSSILVLILMAVIVCWVTLLGCWVHSSGFHYDFPMLFDSIGVVRMLVKCFSRSAMFATCCIK